ncbi:hypothetical protein F66182_1958 [Fusarium sp. NRRL 66182]|nr:hypothetical protein F66182_1958 [Fusarium sp. NRRL 66182]
MKFTSSAVVLAAAIGVSAHPSGHAHQRAHNRREFVVAHKPVTIVEYATHVVTAGAVPTDPPAYDLPDVPDVPDVPEYDVPDVPSPAPAVDPVAPIAKPEEPKEEKPKHKGKQHNKSGSGYKPFCGGKKAKRATLEDIAAKGNTGVPGNFGCNMMTVDADVADKYDYTTTFKNNDTKKKNCVCFNKIGPKGLIDGFWKNNEALSFSVPAKGSQVVAFDTDSQGGCVCHAGEIPTTSIGQWAGTWLEFDFGSERNKGWSGADASCLVSAAHGEKIPGLKVCGHNTCSTINPGGTGENAYLAGMEDLDGVGLNIKPGKARLEVVIDYSG